MSLSEDSSRPTFSTLVITCGNLTDRFILTRKYSVRRSKSKDGATAKPAEIREIFSKDVKVNGDVKCTFNIRTCTANLSEDLSEQFHSTDAFIIFYDMTRPNTVAIYDSFITTIIGSKNKAVRVIGVRPDTSNRSIKKKSQKSKSISSRWGKYHDVLVDRKENEREVTAIYRSIAMELLDIGEKSKKSAGCTIL